MKKSKKIEAAQEVLRRRKAATNLLAFTQYTKSDYQVADHHELIATTLDKVASSELTRLVITMPPQHGKSELASRRFPAYYLGLFPNRKIIFCTYNEDFANDFGKEVRQIMESKEYKNIFPDSRIRKDSGKQDFIAMEAGGYLKVTGVGGSVTGRSGHLLILDDPYKGREEADSKKIRNAVWNFYSTALWTRQNPTENGKPAGIVLIQTRWHEDDLAGALIESKKRGAEDWEVLKLPAINDAGEALWPDRFNLQHLESIRKLDNRTFQCLYQQEPIPDDGLYFKKEWLSYYENYDLPEDLVVYGCSDYALSEGGGDFTVHVMVGIDKDDNYWILDGYVGQDNMLKWIDKCLDLVSIWKPRLWVGEAGQIRRASEPALKKRMSERRTYTRMEYAIRTRDKTSISRSLQSMCAQEKLKIPHTEFGVKIYEQMIKFPAGRHDDFVDALSNLVLCMEKLHGARPVSMVPTITRKMFDFDSGNESNWKTLL